MSDLYKDITDTIYESPWRNVYWFARMLINSDMYDAPGKHKVMTQLVSELEAIIEQKYLTDIEKQKICTKIFNEKITSISNKSAKRHQQHEKFIEDIDKEICSLLDWIVLIVTIKYIVLPANEALNNIPNDDIEFCHTTAKNILDTLGKTKIDRVISVWDNLGVRGCLNIERSELVKEYTCLKSNLSALNIPRSEIEDTVILTAFTQEFERRAAQKRKARAGGSLENVATFLFNYYKLSSSKKPEHLNAAIELDKWFKCKDGWIIGISCKRTLRERWKEVSAADERILSDNKVKQIWHLTTYDRDLSDEKITSLGGKRHIFYLSDDSPIYNNAKNHIGMKDYVRPLSQLIDDIIKEQKG